ncbi:hypothetical protein IMG5_129220 [Ichthyophthirius multifiliis]|uniref:Transmembrane protein n=1 Tax=Ichthyophthirius multifiliis TaxID=5932 RepID=G0QW42_ICHMU|nr:hypothetical protein IMG5_129220 [Ichthyophthirius multifiliis]EGR30562.1 hypothetical protein IMG5_129220 [Ichthyophthirius multifiliis]|eukprot:XP_004032149.1 hypothetical protein IMG5_129220 [Ichthyophthirius multifiliis]
MSKTLQILNIQQELIQSIKLLVFQYIKMGQIINRKIKYKNQIIFKIIIIQVIKVQCTGENVLLKSSLHKQVTEVLISYNRKEAENLMLLRLNKALQQVKQVQKMLDKFLKINLLFLLKKLVSNLFKAQIKKKIMLMVGMPSQRHYLRKLIQIMMSSIVIKLKFFQLILINLENILIIYHIIIQMWLLNRLKRFINLLKKNKFKTIVKQ